MLHLTAREALCAWVVRYFSEDMILCGLEMLQALENNAPSNGHNPQAFLTHLQLVKPMPEDPEKLNNWVYSLLHTFAMEKLLSIASEYDVPFHIFGKLLMLLKKGSEGANLSKLITEDKISSLQDELEELNMISAEVGSVLSECITSEKRDVIRGSITQELKEYLQNTLRYGFSSKAATPNPYEGIFEHLREHLRVILPEILQSGFIQLLIHNLSRSIPEAITGQYTEFERRIDDHFMSGIRLDGGILFSKPVFLHVSRIGDETQIIETRA